MPYRIDRLNNIYIRLNDDGTFDMIKMLSDGFQTKHSNNYNKWSHIYNNYSHSNKREFDEAEKLAQI